MVLTNHWFYSHATYEDHRTTFPGHRHLPRPPGTVRSSARPQLRHLGRLADLLVVAPRRKPLAELAAQELDGVDPSNLADFFRISPWDADAIRLLLIVALCRTARQEAGLLIDYTADGRPIGIEITAPSKVTLEAINRALAAAQQEPATTDEFAPLVAA